MKPKNVEVILNLLLVSLGVISAIMANIVITVLFFTCAILLSLYYIFYYGNEINGSNAFLNIIVRYTLSIFPVCYLIIYINPNMGLYAELVYLILSLLVSAIKLYKGTLDKYELLRFYILYILLTFADVPFK